MPLLKLQSTAPKKLQGVTDPAIDASKQGPYSALKKATSIRPTTDYWQKIKDMIGGATGLPIGDSDSSKYQQMDAATQIMGVHAGIQFPKNLTVYHGTSKNFNKFNPYYNNPNDLFGKMTHFAEDPRYAGGEYTGVKGFIEPDPNFAKTYGLDPNSINKNAPRVIPAKLDVKNALDVTSNDPDMINWDDLTKLAYDKNLFPEGIKRLQDKMFASMINSGGKHYKPSYGPAPNKVPRNWVEAYLKLEPNALSDAGFDAIKYSDNMAAASHHRPEVWAIENTALAKGLWTGEPLGISLKPRNLERLVGGKYQLSPALEKVRYRSFAEEANRVYGLDKIAKSPEEYERMLQYYSNYGGISKEGNSILRKATARVKSIGYSKK